MKVGSLVECVNDNWNAHIFCNNIIRFPVKEKIYTIREIVKLGRHTGVILQEITNPICDETGVEEAFMINRFRELQPPIANIEEHIKENTLEPELV